MIDLKERLKQEKEMINKKNILTEEDLNTIDLIDNKLLELDGVDVKDSIRWTNNKLMVILYPNENPSKDEIEVIVDGVVKSVRGVYNLRKNLRLRKDFLNEYKDFITKEELNDMIIKFQSEASSVVSVISVYDRNETENRKRNANTYKPLDNDDEDYVNLIHPSLSFVNDTMRVGIDLQSKDSVGDIAFRRFILDQDNNLISIPELYIHGLELDRQPVVYNTQRVLRYAEHPDQVFTTTHTTLTTLNDKIEANFEKFIEFGDKRASLFLSIWTIGTYLYQLFNAYPYVSLYGYFGTGKTKVMDLCNLMCWNGQKSVGISAPALFRGTHNSGWTLFFDEAGLFKQTQKGFDKRSEEILPIVLTGYKKGGTVPRVVKKDETFTIEFFDAFCPKIFASTDEMNDILESRAVQIIMTPASPDSKKGELEPKPELDEWIKLRTNILYSCFNEWKTIRDIYDTIENDTELNNRYWEICKPIISIGKHCLSEEKYKELVDYLVHNLSIKKEESSDNEDFLILRALLMINEWKNHITLDDILEKIMAIKGTNRPDWQNKKWLGRRLKKLDLKMMKIRHGNGRIYLFNKENVIETAKKFNVNIEDEVININIKQIEKDQKEKSEVGYFNQ